MNAILYQLAEKEPFHVGLDDAAGKIDGEGILKADDGTVGTGGKGLPHADVEALNKGLPCWSAPLRNSYPEPWCKTSGPQSP